MILPRSKKAFTLIELLVVIGVLAILLTITLIAINPQRQFNQANDTKRTSDINAILNAVGQYAADHKGNLTPLGITANGGFICKGAACPAGSVNICEISPDPLVPTYISALPVDPESNNGTPVTDCSIAAWNTRYYISRTATNRITVSASDAATPVIAVTR